jgi:Polysaccharide lyase
VHSFGHAWDTTAGVHQAPPSAYTETVNGTTSPTTTTSAATTTTPPPSGSVSFDGRAKVMSSLYSYETTAGDTSTLKQGQSPTLWDGLLFLNNDIALTADSNYGQIFSIRTGYNSHNPYYTPTDGRSSELSVRQTMKLGTWDWYSNAFKVKSGWSQPDWAMLYQFGYPTLSSPPLAITADRTSDGVPRFQLFQNGGLLTNKNGNSTYTGSQVGDTPIVAIPFDTWVQIIVGVKWMTDNTGEIHVYYRIPSQSSTWQNPINKTGIPTEQYGTTPYGSCAADFSNCTTVIDHGGLYFGYWSMPSASNFPTNYMSQMGMSRSTTLSAAQSLFP